MTNKSGQEKVECGLLDSNGKAIPLVGVRVFASINDFSSRVTIEQHFHNLEDNPIEAQYLVFVLTFFPPVFLVFLFFCSHFSFFFPFVIFVYDGSFR